jgi:hypothetical protein
VKCASALLAAAFVIGCGGDDDETNADRYDGEEAEVAGLVDDFAEAGRDGDGQRICDQIFADALAANVEKESKQSCATEVEENIPEGDYELEVDSVDVNGDEATAAVTDQDDNKSVLHVVKIDSDWRVLRVTEGT